LGEQFPDRSDTKNLWSQSCGHLQKQSEIAHAKVEVMLNGAVSLHFSQFNISENIFIY